MTPDLLTSTLAVILSLCASYLPGFSTWYEALETVPKRLVMALGLLAIAAAVTGMACAGFGPLIGVKLACDWGGAFVTLKAFLTALAVNQATYQLTKRKSSARRLHQLITRLGGGYPRPVNRAGIGSSRPAPKPRTLGGDERKPGR